ncbi:MAG TPA: class I SAM-dependent methyltransferase [Anaerolineales bacterium]
MMPAGTALSLSDISETLLIPLYVRARESERPDALIHDGKAARMVQRIDYPFSKIRIQEHDEVGILLRVREFDRRARCFLQEHRNAVVVHIGCGLDTRFDRLDDGRGEWFDLDLPPVMELRNALLDEPCPRHHSLAASVFDPGWVEQVASLRPRPFLFLAEGVFPYFEEAQVKSLILGLRDRFPASELVIDAHTPLANWLHNFQLGFSRLSARLHWGLKDPRDLESWAAGIRLVGAWYYFDTPEPRFGAAQWMARFPLLGKMTGIFHYRLG